MPRHLRAVPSGGTCVNGGTPIAVVLAERHEHMRRSLRAVIEAERDLVLLADGRVLADAVKALRRTSAHVLVLDSRLIEGKLADGVTELCTLVSPAAIVMLSADRMPSLADRVLRAGANGFVIKDNADAELPEAVRAAAVGGSFVSPVLRDALAKTAGSHGDVRGVSRITPVGPRG